MEPTVSRGTANTASFAHYNTSSIFDALTQKTLDVESFKYGSPIYKDDVANDKDTIEVTEDGYISEYIDNAEDDDESSVGGDSNATNYSSMDDCDGGKSQADTALIQSVVDPVEWKMELKRVAHILRAQHEDKCDAWKNHLKQSKVKHKKILCELTKCHDNFTLLNEVITTTLEHIDLKENRINDQFESICREFSSYRARNSDLRKSCKDTSSSVEKLSSDLSIITKKLKHIKELVHTKGNSITDTSPLTRMKSALQQIKSEIRSYDLQLGILEHILLHKRIRQSKIQARGHVEQ